MKSIRALLGLTLFGSVVLAGWLYFAARGDQAASRTEGASTAAADRIHATGSKLVRAEEYTYAISMESRVSAGSDLLVQFRIKGGFSDAPFAQDGDLMRSRAALSDLDVTSELTDSASLQKLADFRHGLASPFYSRKSARGEVVEARFSPGTNPVAETVMKSILAYAQVVMPERAGDSWISTESDTSGKYEAQYNRVGSGKFKKTKLRYSQIVGNIPAAMLRSQVYEVQASAALITLDTRGRLVELELDETIRAVSGVLPEIFAKTRLTLKLEQKRTPQTDLASWNQDFDTQSASKLYERRQRGKRQAELDRARFGGQTFQELSGRLRQLGKPTKANQTERARNFVALTALLRQEPASSALAAQAIKKGVEAPYMIAALGNAGNPEAQQALRDLLQDRATSSDLKGRIVTALGDSSEATSETVDALILLASDKTLGPVAKLSLGAATNGLNRSNPVLAQRATRALVSFLNANAGKGAMHNDLRALGNAGSAEALDAILPWLSHKSVEVRISALHALRRIPGARVDDILAEFALTDPSALVRRTAISLVRERAISDVLVEALCQSMKLETDFDARLEAINAAGAWAKINNHVRDSLAWVAQNDTSEKLRAIAELALA